MAHLTPDQLAGQALGQTDQLSDDHRSHLASCPDCQSELDALSRAVTGARLGIAQPPRMPGPQVWERIMADVAADQGRGSAPDPLAAPRADGESEIRVPAPRLEERRVAVGPRRARPGRPRWAVALVAAGLGLVLGIGGTVLVDRVGGRSEVVASATLDPLPGHTARGSAELVRTSQVTELRVQVDSATPADDYRELWLINTDLKRMYSLGVLPTSGSGTYPVPAQLAGGLDGFTIVDVSVEPYDGNALHSRNSLVRGVLPT